MVSKIRLHEIYLAMLKCYGPQGWWPLLELHESGIKTGSGSNPTKTGSLKGYHPGDYSYPKTDSQRFEICVGAILTQNTAWPNVEKALINLKAAKLLSPQSMLNAAHMKLCEAIRPAGYYNQKAKKLQGFAKFYIGLEGRAPSIEELLSLWGIGPETADSMLLYAYGVPTFVVDAYTRRIFSKPWNIGKIQGKGFFDEKATYDEIKQMFESSLKPDTKTYQEFHALIVEHAKRLKAKKPKKLGLYA